MFDFQHQFLSLQILSATATFLLIHFLTALLLTLKDLAIRNMRQMHYNKIHTMRGKLWIIKHCAFCSFDSAVNFQKSFKGQSRKEE